LTEILSLKPEDAKRLHPEALRWFNDQRTTIESEVPLGALSDDDLNTFLSDDERGKFLKWKDEVARELTHCMDIEQRVPPGPLAEAIIGFAVLKSQLGLLPPMDNLRSLLMKVYNRKREAQRKQENEERRQAEKKEEEEEARRRQEQAEAERNLAFEAIYPPIADAKKYLNRPGEYDKFITSIHGAIDAYLTVGEEYLNHTKASEYKWYQITIRDRRQQEAHKLQAIRAANEYNHRINQEIAKLTSRLDHRLKDLSSYFRAKIQDKRFTGHNFDHVLSAEDKGNFDSTLVSVANKKLLQLIPDDLRQFIGLPSRYYRLYFPLPTASYSFEEMPRIDFSFETFVAAYAEIWLKPGKKNFGDYEFLLPQIEEKDYSVTLQKPKFLGYYYLILSPEDIGGYVFWESIPLILLKGLLNGEIKPEGTTISAASDEEVTYRIPKVKDEITIPNSFAGYVKTIGTIDRMVSMNILTEKVASIVIAELNELNVEQEAPPREDKVKREDTKKAKAVQLFSEGKRPSDPEVKSLGIKPNTAYRYHQEWKKTHNHT